jgi:hypothetical protein
MLYKMTSEVFRDFGNLAGQAPRTARRSRFCEVPPLLSESVFEVLAHSQNRTWYSHSLAVTPVLAMMNLPRADLFPDEFHRCVPNSWRWLTTARRSLMTF